MKVKTLLECDRCNKEEECWLDVLLVQTDMTDSTKQDKFWHALPGKWDVFWDPTCQEILFFCGDC